MPTPSNAPEPGPGDGLYASESLEAPFVGTERRPGGLNGPQTGVQSLESSEGAPQPSDGQADRDCPAHEAGIDHTECCPTPETHNWGCGCTTDAPESAGDGRTADRGAVAELEPMCVCGHPVRLHHEDVCLLAGCSCNDCLEPEAVAEACKTSPKGDSKPAPDDGLREQYTAAIHRYDYDNLLATTDIPSDYHRGEADAVMAVRDVRLEQLIKECDSLGRESDRLRRDWVAMHERAERAEAALARARALHVSSKDTRGVGRVSATGAWTPYCEHDSEDWPCPTMHALDGTDATTTEESHQ